MTRLLYPLPPQIASAQGNKTLSGQHCKMQLAWLHFTVLKQRKSRGNILATTFLSECDKRDTLFFYSFGFRILDTSVTSRFSFFIQPFDFLLLLWNFNFLKFMCHWFLPQKPICNVMYILYIYNTPSYIVLYSFLLEL